MKGTHLMNEIPAFYGTQMSITVFTKARQWTLH